MRSGLSSNRSFPITTTRRLDVLHLQERGTDALIGADHPGDGSDAKRIVGAATRGPHHLHQPPEDQKEARSWAMLPAQGSTRLERRRVAWSFFESKRTRCRRPPNRSRCTGCCSQPDALRGLKKTAAQGHGYVGPVKRLPGPTVHLPLAMVDGGNESTVVQGTPGKVSLHDGPKGHGFPRHLHDDDSD